MSIGVQAEREWLLGKVLDLLTALRGVVPDPKGAVGPTGRDDRLANTRIQPGDGPIVETTEEVEVGLGRLEDIDVG